MNVLQAYDFLNKLTEGKADYIDKYKKYLKAHSKKVKRQANWLKKNLPELFDDVDLDAFDEVIEEHDSTKFSDEELEPYAREWSTGEKGFEYDEARKHHIANNEHHPEHWLGENIPYIYILDMLCDWAVEADGIENLSDYYKEKIEADEEEDLSEDTKNTIEEIINKINSFLKEKKTGDD